MKYRIKSYGYDDKYIESEYSSMLIAMKEERIFQVTEDNRGFTIEECCDNNFTVTLTVDQLKALSFELLNLANRAHP